MRFLGVLALVTVGRGASVVSAAAWGANNAWLFCATFGSYGVTITP